MKTLDYVDNWPKAIALILLTAFLFWGFHCTPTVPSLLVEDKKVTRPELQIELDSIIATAEFRLSALDRQEAFRDVIFKNAMLMVEGGGINPIGVITMLAGIYGIARGGKDIKDKITAKRSANA